MNDSLRDAAFRSGVWQFVEQRAKQLKDAAKAELQSLEPGDTVSGKWHGQPVAKATMTAGRMKLVITDDAQFYNWLMGHHPTEVVTQVNPAFLKQLEQRAKELGSPIGHQGELIPGTALTEGDPFVSVRKADGAEDVIAELFRVGALGLDGITPAALPPVVDAAHLDSMPVNRWTADGVMG